MKIKPRTLTIIIYIISILLSGSILTYVIIDYRKGLLQMLEHKQRFEESQDTINKSDTYNYTEFIQEN